MRFLKATLVFILPVVALQSAHAGTSDIAKGLAKCLEAEPSRDRLVCFERIAREANPEQPASHAEVGKWKILKAISPLDDSPIVTATLIAETPITDGYKKRMPSLVIRCKSWRTELFIDSGVAGAGRSTPVSYRLDKERAIRGDWTNSSNGEAVFFNVPNDNYTNIDFMKELVKHKQLLIEMLPYNANPTMTVFELEGAAKAIDQVASACRWKL